MTTREKTADHADHIGDVTTMIDHAELAACPFCGGKAVLRDGMGEFWVCCDDCGASGSMRSRQDRAVRDWNARPREEALLSEIAALKGELAKTKRDYSELRDSYDRVSNKLCVERTHGTAETKRATQAERRGDEAVGLLRDWMGTWFVDADSRGEQFIADDTRKFLANQGADQ